MAAQNATDLRRLLADVEANEKVLRLRQDELEAHLLAAPAANWPEAARRRAIFSSCSEIRWPQKILGGRSYCARPRLCSKSQPTTAHLTKGNETSPTLVP